MKNFFHGGRFGFVLANYIPQPKGDFRQAAFEASFGTGADCARRDEAMGDAVTFTDGVTGRLRPAINAQHAHYCARASNSFSSISKFEYTCCTSSCSSRASVSFRIVLAFLPSTLMRFFGT